MIRRVLSGSIAVAFAVAGFASAQEEAAPQKLAVGDKAPALDVAHWLKGEEVKEFKEGEVYVVEFWATWCGPCRAGMPHLSEVQKEYKDYGVRILGISDEKLQTVFNFLKQDEWDGKTQYTVATDPDRSVYNAYMKAAGQNGIPTAFVVGKTGEVEWIGHPMNMDPVLEKIVRGGWDREAHAAEERSARQAMTKLNEGMSLLADQGTAEEGLSIVKEHIKAVWNNGMALNNIAWNMATEGYAVRDLDFCLKVAERAVELTENKSGMVLDTLARIYYEKGDVKKALEIQKQAVGCAEPEVADQLKEWLEKYEKEAKGG